MKYKSSSIALLLSRLFPDKKWKTTRMTCLVFILPTMSILGTPLPIPKTLTTSSGIEHVSSDHDKDTLSTVNPELHLHVSPSENSTSPLLTFTIQADVGIINENDGATTVIVTAQLNTGVPYNDSQTLEIAVSGSGRADAVDFNRVPNFNIVVPANQRSGSASFMVIPENDRVDEVHETISITSTSPLVSSAAAPITLQDDDAPPTGVTLRSNASALFEEGGDQEVILYAEILSPTTYATSQVIPITVSGTQTQEVVKFSPVASFDITLPAEAASVSTTFTITPENNLVDEDNGTIMIESTASFVIGFANINLIDDDPTPSITLSASPSSVAESNGSTQVTISADWDSQIVFPTDQAIPLIVTGSGITAAVDFLPVPDFNLTIPQGVLSGAATFTLILINDSEDELDETITVSSSSPLINESATIVLEDDDDAPGNISLTADPSEINEGDGATLVTLTATIGSGTTFSETKAFSIDVTSSGQDNVVNFSSVSSFDIVFAPRASTSTATLQLAPLDDDENTDDEIITLSSTDPSITGSAFIRLVDDDAPAIILLRADPSSVSENDGETAITVTATLENPQSFNQDQILPITVNGSGRANAVDFTPVPDFDLLLPAGSSTTSTTFLLKPTDDSQDESDELITIASTQEFVTNSATVMLLDDDETPTIRLTITPESIREDGGPTEISVTATVNGSTQSAVTQVLPIAVTGSGVSEAVDFLPVPNFNLILSAGTSTTSENFTLTPVNDSEDESDELVLIESSSPLVTSRATLMILDDDDPGQVQLSVTPTIVHEENETQTITITGTIASGQAFSEDRIIPLSVRGSGQPHVVDFEPVADLELIFTTDHVAATVTFDILPIDDLEFESNETLTISSTDMIVEAPVTLQLINDDERPEGITLSTFPESIREDTGPTVVTVTASVKGGTRYTTSQEIPLTITNTGEPNSVQSLPITGVILTIPAGEASGTIEVEVTPQNNNLYQPNGMLTIGSESNIVLNSSMIRLENDDVKPAGISVSLDPSTISEDAGEIEITLTVQVTGNTLFGVDQNLTLQGTNSGVLGAVNFSTTLPPALSLPAGTRSTSTKFVVEPINNNLDESNETLTILAQLDDYSATADLLITDDDATPVGFELEITPNIMVEGDGPTTINVTASLTGDSRYATPQILDFSISQPTIGFVGYESISDFQIEVPAGAESGTNRFTLIPIENTTPEIDATILISALHMGVTISTTLLLQDDDESTIRIYDVNAILTPEVSRAIIASSVGAVHERFRVFQKGSLVQTSKLSHGLSRIVLRFENDRYPRSLVNPQWASLLNRASLATRITKRITVWAHADYRSLSGSRIDSPLSYDGNITGLHGGIDLSFKQFLVGLSVSQFYGDLDYNHSASSSRLALTAPIKGLYQIDARMLTPYINWSWNPRSSVWAMMSLSSGEVRISDSDLALEEANISLGALAAGIDFGLITEPSGFSLDLKGAAWSGQMNMDDNTSRIKKQDLNVSRFQMSLEGSYQIRLPSQGLLQPFAEAGLRSDHGHGQTGIGMEMSGGARLSLPSAGLHVSGNGQFLVLHERDINEWAFSGILRYSPGGNTGPNVELRSSTGPHFRSFQEVWQDSRWHSYDHGKNPSTQLQSRLGYGFNINHRSLVNPYTGLEIGHGIAPQLGAEYRIGSQLNIRMEAAYFMQSSLHQSSPTIRAQVLLR